MRVFRRLIKGGARKNNCRCSGGQSQLTEDTLHPNADGLVVRVERALGFWGLACWPGKFSLREFRLGLPSSLPDPVLATHRPLFLAERREKLAFFKRHGHAVSSIALVETNLHVRHRQGSRAQSSGPGAQDGKAGVRRTDRAGGTRVDEYLIEFESSRGPKLPIQWKGVFLGQHVGGG
jgi:hypothetical protein